MSVETAIDEFSRRIGAMSTADLQALRPGDRVMTYVGSELVEVEVTRAAKPANRDTGTLCVRVRRPGLTISGRKYSQMTRLSFEITPVPDKRAGLDPTPANVYADWLEEHGEPGAAAKLREAFPLEIPAHA